MSRGLDTWYSLPDLDHLARRGTVIAGTVELRRLARLGGLLSSEDGEVNARLSVKPRADGQLDLQLDCSATVTVECQRCLEPMRYTLSSSLSCLVVEEDWQESRSGSQLGEILVLEGGRFNPRDLIEEELIVSLPLAPKHDARSQCGAIARDLERLEIEDAPESPSGAGEPG